MSNLSWGSKEGRLRVSVFRYGQAGVYRYLLTRAELQVNLQNCHGQTALHTAARWSENILNHKNILQKKNISGSMCPGPWWLC